MFERGHEAELPQALEQVLLGSLELTVLEQADDLRALRVDEHRVATATTRHALGRDNTMRRGDEPRNVEAERAEQLEQRLQHVAHVDDDAVLRLEDLMPIAVAILDIEPRVPRLAALQLAVDDSTEQERDEVDVSVRTRADAANRGLRVVDEAQDGVRALDHVAHEVSRQPRVLLDAAEEPPRETLEFREDVERRHLELGDLVRPDVLEAAERFVADMPEVLVVNDGAALGLFALGAESPLTMQGRILVLVGEVFPTEVEQGARSAPKSKDLVLRDSVVLQHGKPSFLERHAELPDEARIIAADDGNEVLDLASHDAPPQQGFVGLSAPSARQEYTEFIG